MKENTNEVSAMSHNVCYDKKFREYLWQYFNSYFEYVVDLNGRCGLTMMLRKSLFVLFDINPIVSIYRREDGILVNRLRLISNDGRFDFGFVMASFDGISVTVDFNGIN